MEKIVRHRVDLSKPPVVTDQQRAELRALAKRPDSEIDFSDIPELTEDFFRNGIRSPYFRGRTLSQVARDRAAAASNPPHTAEPGIEAEAEEAEALAAAHSNPNRS